MLARGQKINPDAAVGEPAGFARAGTHGLQPVMGELRAFPVDSAPCLGELVFIGNIPANGQGAEWDQPLVKRSVQRPFGLRPRHLPLVIGHEHQTIAAKT